MSLLLDALKRAEQEKMARNDETPPAAPERPAASGKPLLELQPMPSGGIAPGASSAAKADVHAAQTAFAAKAVAQERPSHKGLLLWGLLGATALVVIGAAGYVWYAMQAPGPLAARPRPAPQQPPVMASALQPQVEAPQAAAAGAAPPKAMPATPTTTSAGNSGEPRRSRTEPRDPETLMASLLKEAAVPAAAPLKLAPAASLPQIPANVSAGYEQLRKGDLAGARNSYAAALTSDPSNIDSLLGMATVEARSGNRAAAAANYRKALVVDAYNGTALAGLASLADYAHPNAVEAQLRMDLARNPESAALHFALGNLYASQSRWNEAQARYFDAHRLDPANPDVAFNLAVSLDHLGQSRLAAEFYGQALEAAARDAAQFDAQAARRRIADLKR